MPRNGSGAFSRVHDWTADADAAINIRADRMDEDADDIAQAISDSIAKNGETTTTAQIPFASGIKTNAVSENTAGSGVTVDSVLLKDAQIRIDGPTNVLGTVQADSPKLFTSSQRTTNVAPNATTAIFRFLDQDGTQIGKTFVSGTLYIHVRDQSDPTNNTSVVRTIDSTGNGATDSSTTGIDAAIRGTAVITGFAVQADGVDGGVKYAITTPNNGLTCTVYCTFVGLVD